VTFNSPYGSYNVEASLGEWFRVNVTANGSPSWMWTARTVYGWDEESPIMSGSAGFAFSVNFLGSNAVQQFQGRRVGADAVGHTREGLMEINTWVSKQHAKNAYRQRLAQAGDMVHALLTSAHSVPITHVYGSQAQPTGIGAVARLMDYDEVGVGPDPNPDMLRRRFLVRYQWIQRVTG